MRQWLRSHLTYANVMATLAVFLVLGGGTALGAFVVSNNSQIGPNTVSGHKPNPGQHSNIIPGTVNATDLAASAVTGPKIAANAVTGPKVTDNSLTGADVASLTGADVTDNSLTGSDVNEASLGLVPNADALDGISSSGFWKLGGNAGTSGSDFLGTTDSQPLNLRVNNARGLRLEPASDGTNQSPNVIGGIADNSVTAGVHAATIGGGGRGTPANSATANRVTDDLGTVGGGANNQAGDGAGTVSDTTLATVGGGISNTAGAEATVGGGNTNTASGGDATLGGGFSNTASGVEATIGGGSSNTASAFDATVGGGGSNTASGQDATVPGGFLNTAQGDFSFAAGDRAKANHNGAFVWADSQGFNFASTANDEFSVRSTGGARFVSAVDGFGNPTAGVTLASGGGSWASLSDEASKTAITPVSGRAVLRKLGSVPVSEWSYRAQGPSIRHIGPMAQDLSRAFGVGEDPRHITSVDADGISLAAIKALNEKVRALEHRSGVPTGDSVGPSGDGSSVPLWALVALAALGLAGSAALGAALALRWQGALRGTPATS